MQTSKELFVSPLLTNISLAYGNESYVAEQIFPVVTVKKETGQIASYQMDNLRLDSDYRAQGGSTNEVDHRVNISSHYRLIERALKELVADEEVENADKPITPKMDAVENITDKLLVRKEKNLADIVFNIGNITSYTTLSTATQWSNFSSSTSDPIGDIQTGKNTVRGNSGLKANSILLSYDSFSKLLDHPDIIDRIKYTVRATKSAAQDAMAALFGMDNLYIGEAQYNAGEELETDSLTDIWKDKALVFYNNTTPRTRSRSLGYTYQMTAPRVVDSWYDADRKGTWFRVTDKFDQQLVDAKCGYLITNTLA